MSITAARVTPTASTATQCPANKSTFVFSAWYFGVGYIKYTINVSVQDKVKATKYYNGIPYSWPFYGTTTFNVYPGYTSVYLTPPVNCSASVVQSGQ